MHVILFSGKACDIQIQKDEIKEAKFVSLTEFDNGLTGNINNAMKHVNTKYVMLVQHDLEFVENINVDNII